MLKTTTAVEGGEGGVPEGELTLQLQADNDRHMTSDIVNGSVVVDDLKPSLSGEILRLSFVCLLCLPCFSLPSLSVLSIYTLFFCLYILCFSIYIYFVFLSIYALFFYLYILCFSIYIYFVFLSIYT